MNPISKRRFDALAGYIRAPASILFGEELEWFSQGDDRVLGLLIRDRTDNDFGGIVLGRDGRGRFRAVDLPEFSNSINIARETLRAKLGEWEVRPRDDFLQEDESGTQVDVFLPVVAPERLHTAFARIATWEGFSPARALIESMMPYFEDVDGNFVEQFQSNGFDARFWELYLFAVLTEEGFSFDRAFQAPDYACVRIGQEVFVEAVTVNPTTVHGIVAEPAVPEPRGDLTRYLREYMPIKWGSSLTSKLRKRYWELPHVTGKPIAFAIQDFHVPRAMTFTGSTLAPYLYGLSFTALFDEHGRLGVKAQRRDGHEYGDKKIESGFFYLEDAENVSAVLSNPTATISKFNRMAVLAGMGSRDVRMVCHGFRHDHKRDAAVPIHFVSAVGEPGYSESWAQGLNVFHNPCAKHPLDESFFPEAAHHFWTGDQLVSRLPEFHPYNSETVIIAPKRLHE